LNSEKYSDFVNLIARFYKYLNVEYSLKTFSSENKERIEALYNYFGPEEVLRQAVSWFIRDLNLRESFINKTPEELDIYLTLRGY